MILVFVRNTTFIVTVTYEENTIYETGAYGTEEGRGTRALQV